MRELFFINSITNSGKNIFYSKKAGDFKVKKYIFEIGGKGKSKKQLHNARGKSFVVKDDILIGDSCNIPLYIFGFLY